MTVPRKGWSALGGLALAGVAAAGIAYAAIPDSGGVFHACVLDATGTIRLIDPSLRASKLRSHCTQLESEVEWNQQGQPGAPGAPGPPGNTDSTVRHISNFMLDGTSVSTPVLSAKGELGKLTLSCDHNANGASGTIRFTDTVNPAFQARVIFSSPDVPGSPAEIVVANPEATFPWADASADNVIFEMLVEDEPGSTEVKPTLTDIHGFVQHISFEPPPGGGCAFYVHLDTSEINSGETFTAPSG